MKKIVSWLLLAATVLSLFGCGAQSAPAEAPEAQVAPTAEQTIAPETEPVHQTEPELLPGKLFLKASSVTFSLVGETDDIYRGMGPREEVTWQSEAPAIVSVENGVLTANAVGTTVVRATYGDQVLECAVGCLAQTQEELEALPAEVLSAPKRLPPQIDLEEPCTYFDNAAMIGDSITYHLWQSEAQNNYLGNVLFLTRNGVSINSIVRRFKNIYFEGKEMFIEDIVAKCGAQRIYLMLGCLDFQVTAARGYLMDSWNTMLDLIIEKNPDVEIVIISNIPCLPDESTPEHMNATIDEVNGKLRQLCADRGFGFLDLHYYVEDHLGRIPLAYDKDVYHMNGEGSLVWMKVMRHFAEYELEGGSLS